MQNVSSVRFWCTNTGHCPPSVLLFIYTRPTTSTPETSVGGLAERQEICRLQCLDGSGLVGQGCEGGGLSGQARTVEQSDICEITLPGSLSFNSLELQRSVSGVAACWRL